MKAGFIDRGIRRAVQPLLVPHLKYQVEFRCIPRLLRTRLLSLALDVFVLVLPQMECGRAMSTATGQPMRLSEGSAQRTRPNRARCKSTDQSGYDARRR